MEHKRGLFSMKTYENGEPITPYAGVMVCPGDFKSLTPDQKAFLKHFMHTENCAIDGFRELNERLDEGQLSNDMRNYKPENA